MDKKDFWHEIKLFARSRRNALRFMDCVDVFHMMDHLHLAQMIADSCLNNDKINLHEYLVMCDLIIKMRDQAFDVAIDIRTFNWSIIQEYSRKE